MIKFIIKGKKNPQKKTETKYYAQIAPTTPLMLPQIVKLIEKRSTVSSSDIKAVLDALQFEIIHALQTGNSVRLGDLGSFHLTISSKGTVTEEEAKKAGANLIKKVSVQFVKSAEMGRAFSLDELSFVQG
jgi:putative DNA-binding protein